MLKITYGECVMTQITSDRIFAKKKVAERLNQALAARNVDKHGRGSELARITGTSPQAAAKWLTGKVAPSIANLLRISRAFDISVEWLISGEVMMLIDKDFFALSYDWQHADESGKN